MNARKSSFIIQGSILAFASISSRIIGLIYKIVLTRKIGFIGMGYYNIAYDYYNIALIISSLSIPLAISKLIAAREQRREYKNSYKIFTTAIIISLITGGAAAFILFVFADKFAAISKLPDAAYPLRVLAPTLLVVAVLGVLRGLFQGKKTMVPTAMSQIFEQVVNAFVSVFAAIWLITIQTDTSLTAAYGAMGGTLGTLVGAGAGFLFMIVVFLINLPLFRKQRKRDKDPVPESTKEAATAIVFTIFPIIMSQFVFQASGLLDNIIFGNHMSLTGLNQEQIAALYESYSNKYRQLTNVPVAIAAAMSSAVVPSLSSSFAIKDMISIRNKIASSIKLNMLLAIPSAVGMSVLGKPIIELLYKDTSKIDSNLLCFGSIAIVFFAYSSMTNGILQGINRIRVPMINSSISLVIHVLLMIFMLKTLHLSVYSLLLGNISFSFIICILNWLSIKQYTDYKQEVIKTFALPFVSSIIMGIITRIMYNIAFQISGNNLIGILFAVPFAVIVYFVFVIVFGAATESELSAMPKGRKIVSLCKKVHLLK